MDTRLAEILVTTAVTTAMALAIFTALRVVFPEPAIEGSHCPAALGEPAYSECVRSWHTSHAERADHRVATGVAVVALATVGLLALERGPRRIPRLRVPLAFSMAAGLAAAWAIACLTQGSPRIGLASLAVGGLFGIAAYLHHDRPRWWQHAAAAALGAAAFLVTVLVYVLFFHDWP